jgi:predicted anti-sigma-YlaC factor YlaD
MKNCEHHEASLSAWLDGQLDRAGQVECLDHVVRCASCRDFYLDARALEGLMATLRTPAETPPAPPEIWKRIEWETRAAGRRTAHPRRRAFALQAAAVLVLALGLSVLVWNDRVAPAPGEAEVRLGEGGDMSESRFIELTKEVLRADPRYHAAMFQVMEQVVRDTSGAEEAGPERPSVRPERPVRAEGGEARVRIPA